MTRAALLILLLLSGCTPLTFLTCTDGPYCMGTKKEKPMPQTYDDGTPTSYPDGSPRYPGDPLVKP